MFDVLLLWLTNVLQLYKYKGENMKIDFKKDSQNVAKVEIEIPAKDGLNAYNRAVKAYAQHVNIPSCFWTLSALWISPKPSYSS